MRKGGARLFHLGLARCDNQESSKLDKESVNLRDGLLRSAVVLVGDATGGKGHAPGLADASELCQDNERVEIEMGREQ